MQLFLIGLVSSEWGVARFITDSLALTALAVLCSLPILLIKDKVVLKNIWSSGNALSNR